METSEVILRSNMKILVAPSPGCPWRDRLEKEHLLRVLPIPSPTPQSCILSQVKAPAHKRTRLGAGAGQDARANNPSHDWMHHRIWKNYYDLKFHLYTQTGFTEFSFVNKVCIQWSSHFCGFRWYTVTAPIKKMILGFLIHGLKLLWGSIFQCPLVFPSIFTHIFGVVLLGACKLKTSRSSWWTFIIQSFPF